MSLGILKVAAVLEQAGVEVEMLDLSGVEDFEQVLKSYLVNSDIDCFGLTATTPQMPAATKLLNQIRSIKPTARVILGGPHVTLIHSAYKYEIKHRRVGRAQKAFRQIEEMYDVLVVGDGEMAIFEALQDSAPKLVDGDDPRSELFLNNEKLNVLPFPARHLVDVGSYRYSIDGVRALSMIAQLGCPFGCGFCGGRMSPFLRRVRMRTSENIVEEMVYMYQTYGVTGFMLYDDELNVNPKIVELMGLIARAQEKLDVEFRLRGFIKAELFTDQQAEAMYNAGFRWILVGFESGHERILTNIQKKASKESNTRCIEIAKKHNLRIKALMSVGHPGESEETVHTTHDWLSQVQPDDFDVTLITTYPGTPYFDEAIESKPGIWTYTFPPNGDRLHSVEVDYRTVAEYYKGIPGEYTAYIYTDYLSSEELTKLRDWMEASLRKKLAIPFNPSSPGVRYEHSMGQGWLPASILRISKKSIPVP